MYLLDVVTCCNVGEAELQRVVLSSIDSKSTHLQLLHYSSGFTDFVASCRYWYMPALPRSSCGAKHVSPCSRVA